MFHCLWTFFVPFMQPATKAIREKVKKRLAATSKLCEKKTSRMCLLFAAVHLGVGSYYKNTGWK
uniref:Uncharacterized protein n=1 Tax=Arundo donax TaxID=35708 RepID=A0A0A9DIU1_ARUDO